jgi:hypothetical protein
VSRSCCIELPYTTIADTGRVESRSCVNDSPLESPAYHPASFSIIIPMTGTDIGARLVVNVLYAAPLPPSQVSRLSSLRKQLGPDTDDRPYLTTAPFTTLLRKSRPPSWYFPQSRHRLSTRWSSSAQSEQRSAGQEVLETACQWSGHLVGLYLHFSLGYSNSIHAQVVKALVAAIGGCVNALKRGLAALVPIF